MFTSKLKTIVLIFSGGICCPAGISVYAQKAPGDYDYLKKSTPWLTSGNMAGLSNFTIGSLSFAESYVRKDNGRFINYFESDNSYQYGVNAESFYRLNSKLVFYGAITYSNFTGKNMGGTSSIDPGYNSFNMDEYADSTAGKKQKETYGLSGGFSTQLLEKLYGGLKVDYQTVSYFKTKDLRHANDLLDMTVSGGLKYTIKNHLQVGFNYSYRRTSEEIVFSSAGNKDQEFNTLIDYGLFLGKQERFGDMGTGYTVSGDKKPYSNRFHGVSIQGEYQSGRYAYFNEIGYQNRSGYFGVKSSTAVVFMENSGNIYNYRGVFTIQSGDSHHQIEGNIQHETNKNEENSFQRSTTDGGVTTVTYYGKNTVGNKKNTEASINYTGNISVKQDVPNWVINGEIRLFERRQTAIYYPLYRKQNIHLYSGSIAAKRNFIKGKHIAGPYLSGLFAKGGGGLKTDGIYTSGTSTTTKAVSLDHLLVREYEYLTADRVSAAGGFRYTEILPANKMSVYADVCFRFTKAFSISQTGDTFRSLSIRIGCTF